MFNHLIRSSFEETKQDSLAFYNVCVDKCIPACVGKSLSHLDFYLKKLLFISLKKENKKIIEEIGAWRNM